MRFPPSLREGARVALVSPSGPLRDPRELQLAIDNTKSFGWVPVVGDHALARDGYLAGSDDARAADLNKFARDDSIDAVWCIRGGYGAMRILDALDYDAWCRRPRALIGYSDITALHSAIGSRAELVTFHGPTARADLSDFTRSSFRAMVSREDNDAELVGSSRFEILRPGRATGRLAGGNLALVASLVGTPYALNLDGAILVLEDVSESVYRLDRMLSQLSLSGALDRLAGLVFGQFTEIPDDASNAERPLDRLLEEFARRCGVPCLANFALGHITDQVTLPLGASAELDAGKKEITIILE